MADERIGAVLGDRYRIISWIASGSMGEIYRAERLQLGRSVAIKVLRAPLADNDRFIQRFEVEARALSRLSHPNCVSIIDFGFAGAPYLVMDFIHGRTLRDLIQSVSLEPRRALHIFRQVLAALAHAHGHGIVHRDVKPGNAMLTEATGTGDFVRILDFGLARLASAALETDVSGSAKVAGTPFYISPEQAKGQQGDVRSDIYSAGVLLYEMLAGKKPFDSEDMLEVFRMHFEQEPPPLRGAGDRELSEQLEAAVHTAMAKDPDRRFQSALEFAEALDGTPEADQPLFRFQPPAREITENIEAARRGLAARAARHAVAIGGGAAAIVALLIWCLSAMCSDPAPGGQPPAPDLGVASPRARRADTAAPKDRRRKAPSSSRGSAAAADGSAGAREPGPRSR